MGTSIEFTDKQQRVRGNGAASGRRFARTGTQRLRAGLTSVAPTALGLGPETNQRRPTLQEAKDGAPAGGSHLTSKQIRENARLRLRVRKGAAGGGFGVLGGGDFGVGGPGDCLDFLD